MQMLGSPAAVKGQNNFSAQVGKWQPLPHILTGYCVYPFHPLVGHSALSPSSPSQLGEPGPSSARSRLRNRFSWSGIHPEQADARHKANAYEVPLDVGDEFFAFEEYRCTLEEDGRGELWYRGYVIQAVSLLSLSATPSPSPLPSLTSPSTFPRPEPSVLVGIFPASVVQARQSADDGDPLDAYQHAVRLAEEQARNAVKGYEMEAVAEEDEAELSPGKSTLVTPNRAGDGVVLGAEFVTPHAQGQTRRALGAPSEGLSRPNRPKSLILSGATGAEVEDGDKEQPPLPTLTAGDSTVAGQHWPLIDEIACAIREWYGRLPTYLANREYRLFNLVIQHIDALFLGRRQLLAQTLSADELVRVRRECVSRLVKCNVAQGLEVIVRSLDDGGVMVVDRARAISETGYMTGITAYVYQVQLAYIDLIPLDTLFSRLPSPMTNPRHSLQAVAKSVTTGSFYHLLLDVRAFVAAPCTPGETVELYFSLYSKSDNRFLTEEYCLILNHLGSPARDAEQRLGKLRTLFIDLKGEEVNGQIFVVCRMIRNGALRSKSELGSSLHPSDSRRRISLRPTGTYLAPNSESMRSKISIMSTHTDDSWSITSGFAGHRTNTIDTSYTATTVIDGRPTFRRPLGCAVLELPKANRLLSDGGMEFSMPIFAPSDEAVFATLHEDIIFGRLKDAVISASAEAIAVGVRLMQGDVDQLIREHPSLLAESPLSARLGFPDVVLPQHDRNDIYVKLWSADFYPSPSAGGGSLRLRKAVPNLGNVQITIEVRKSDGSTIHEALFAGGSGEPPIPVFHSMCFTHTDRPTYGELIKVSLPPAITEAHLFLVFRSRGKDKHAHDPQELERPFAIAYLPLVGAGGAVKDGGHDLVLYRPEKPLLPGPPAYFELPPKKSGSSKTFTPLRDRVTLRTYLASTIHSQDDAIRSLCAWQNHPALAEVLNTFSFVGEEEIAKFIPDILDALFGIITSDFGSRQEEMDGLAFAAIVRVLSMSTDRRFPNFDTALDSYIARRFNRPASASQLLSTMKTIMSAPNSKSYRSFLKVWHLFFRFIIRSRELDRARGIGLDATSAHIEADFQRQVKAVLGEINNLMRSTDKGLIGTQTLAIQHYADLLPSLAKIFPPIEIAEIVIAFADNLSAVSGNMAVYKLLLLLQVVKSVFGSAESRALLIPALVRWVKPHLRRYDEGYAGGNGESESARDTKRIKWLECNRLAVTEWLDSTVVQEDQHLLAQEQDNLEYCLSLLPNLCDSYAELRSNATTSALTRQRSDLTVWKDTPDIFPMTHPFALVAGLPPPSLLEQQQNADEAGLNSAGTYNCGLAECGVVILSLILATPRDNISRYLVELLDIEGKERCSTRLRGVLTFCSSVIHYDAFPRQWLSLSLMAFSAVIKLLYPVIDLIRRPEFIPPINDAEQFDDKLFSTCLELLCDLCGSEELALEDHTQQKRRAGWIIAGDLRDEGAGLLLSLWEALGWSGGQGSNDRQLRHGGYQTRFTGLAERILVLCLSSHDQLCETAVEILYSMIYAEYLLLGNFTNIESEIFTKLDLLFSQHLTTSDASDSTMRAYFITQLRTLFESQPSSDPQFSAQFGAFLDEVELFIDLLLGVRDLPDTVEWKDERAAAIYRLIDFIKRVGRTELFVRFIHQLVRINAEAKDWLGAGLAMKLHAEAFDWDDGGALVPAWSDEGISLPAQTQFARRESLYYHAIDYFAEAEAYEFALELCQELAIQHQDLTYNIDKLTALLNHQAKLWERMGEASRPKPEYFRIAYFGDSANQGKEFVVRGQPWQRYVEFCEAIQVKFPRCTIHRSKVPPSAEATEAGDIVWVTSVQPEPDASHPALRPGVHANIQAYYRNNAVRRFVSVRPYIKDGRAGDEGVLTWTEKTTLTVAEELPGLLSRSEIINIQYEEISPLTSAITEIQRGTDLLRSLFLVDGARRIDVKQLGTALNGAVDSPVSGGVKLYRDAFLDPAYLRRNPTEAAQVREFHDAYKEYVRTVHKGLEVHGRVCKDMAFHEALKNHFYKAFPDESARLSSLSTPADDTPAIRTTPETPPRLTTSILKAFQTSPRPSARTSSLNSVISPALPVPYTVPPQLFPPLRLGPAPIERPTPVTALGSPRPVTVSDSTSLRSHPSPSPNTGSGSGSGAVPSLSTRALSIVGSIGRSSSLHSGDANGAGAGRTLGRPESIRTQSGKRASVISNSTFSGEGDNASRIAHSAGDGDVVNIGAEREKSMLKRLSTLMRRDSAA